MWGLLKCVFYERKIIDVWNESRTSRAVELEEHHNTIVLLRSPPYIYGRERNLCYIRMKGTWLYFNTLYGGERALSYIRLKGTWRYFNIQYGGECAMSYISTRNTIYFNLPGEIIDCAELRIFWFLSSTVSLAKLTQYYKVAF